MDSGHVAVRPQQERGGGDCRPKGSLELHVSSTQLGKRVRGVAQVTGDVDAHVSDRCQSPPPLDTPGLSSDARVSALTEPTESPLARMRAAGQRHEQQQQLTRPRRKLDDPRSEERMEPSAEQVLPQRKPRPRAFKEARTIECSRWLC